MRLILECSDELVEPEVVALAINLASSARNTQIMCNGPGLKLVMRRALKTKDSLLFKMIRNMAKCSDPRMMKQFLVSERTPFPPHIYYNRLKVSTEQDNQI